MPYSHITTGTTQVSPRPVYSTKLTVNLATTGTLTIVDNISGSTPVVAVITNPVAGDVYEYWGLRTGLRVIASATTDVTVNWQANRQPS